jgi:secreted Zn-dependent insulinase-like peptidase
MLESLITAETTILLKSSYDNRQFDYIELANGLRILLVQDPNCEKSACSITLNVGHFDDDKDCHGLSHLLEHSLFLGNAEFPMANAFSDFLDLHGGSVNAITGTEYTRYFYEIAVDFELEALTHLSAMLRVPLFSEENIQREIQAIDAEFLLKQKDDLRRLYQVHKETCNPAHPFSQFSVGNKHTFAPFNSAQLKRKLIRLHQKHYQPGNAGLCLISRNSLAESRTLVNQVFANWPSGHSTEKTSLPALYLSENLGIQINILPLQNAKRLILTFALPEQQSHFRSKPLSVISHILGDEGEGSLLDFYKTQNWATSLSAGGGIEGSTFKDFNINLQLTDEGIEQCDEIVAAFFSYIQIMKNNEVELWRVEETEALNQLLWDFPEHDKSIDEATHFSQALFEYPAEYLVAGDYVLNKPSPELISQMLALFTPQNLRIKMLNPKVITTQEAKWYETPYGVLPISKQRITTFLSGKWQEYFALPKPNVFLAPLDNMRKPEQAFSQPKLIIEEKGLNVWFGQDNQFLQPKGHCFLTFDCEAVNEGIQVTAAKRLWIALLNEKLNQKYYQANLAGMHFHFYPHLGGFSLQTNGFSASQLNFCSKLLTQIVATDDFSVNFEQVKEKQYQSLCNALLNKPVNRLFSRLAVIIQQQNQTPLEMAQIMKSLKLEDILNTKQKLLEKFHLEGLMYGNWSKQDADNISNKIRMFRHSCGASNKVHRGVADLRNEHATYHHVDCQHKDPAVVVYFQAPNASLHTVALTILAEQLIAAPFFNQLRTEQQFGYLVGSGYIPYNDHPGIGFYIQSPRYSVDQMINAIHTFLQQVIQNIAQYHHVWDPLKKGVIKQLSEHDTNLSMKSQRLWMAIGKSEHQFTYASKITQTILNIEFTEMKSYFENLVIHNGFGEVILYSGEQRSRLNHPQSTIINDIQEFKFNSPYL